MGGSEPGGRLFNSPLARIVCFPTKNSENVRGGGVLVAFWRRFGGVLASFWRRFGIVLASFWHRFGVVLASFCHHFGVILASFWRNFGIIWASFGHHFQFSKFQNVNKMFPIYSPLTPDQPPQRLLC